MSIVFKVAQTDAQFEQILQLQQQNLMATLSEEQQAKEGFVYARHTIDLLKTMAARLPQIIALHEDRLVGYNLSMHSSMAHALPELTPMFEAFDSCHYKGNRLTDYAFIVGGQVCVAKAYRGQGLLKKLYHATRESISPDYQLCVTEIADNNLPSLKAHRGMGFETLHTYHDGRTLWHIVAWAFPQAEPCMGQWLPKAASADASPC
jgi:GNAT superfamily N-acetyltransferase